MWDQYLPLSPQDRAVPAIQQAGQTSLVQGLLLSPKGLQALSSGGRGCLSTDTQGDLYNQATSTDTLTKSVCLQNIQLQALQCATKVVFQSRTKGTKDRLPPKHCPKCCQLPQGTKLPGDPKLLKSY